MGKSKGLSENPQHLHEKLPVTPALCEVATEESLDLLAASLVSRFSDKVCLKVIRYRVLRQDT